MLHRNLVTVEKGNEKFPSYFLTLTISEFRWREHFIL